MTVKNLLEKLLHVPSKHLTIVVTIAALALFIALTFLMRTYDIALVEKTSYGVIDFEFAYSHEQASKILDAWGDEYIPVERFVTYLDFGYIAAYVIFMSGLTLLFTRTLTGNYQTAGLIVCMLPLTAGTLDVVENIQLLIMLDDPLKFAGYVPQIGTICAGLKFGLIIVVAVFVLGGFVLKTFVRVKRRARE